MITALRTSNSPRRCQGRISEHLDGRPAIANQIEFINMIIDHFTDQDPGLLYGSPFIDLSPKGVDGLFLPDQVALIISTLSEIRHRAAA